MKKTAALLVVFCAVAASSAARADPPTSVGRLSLIEGAASVRHSYDQQWVAAGVNFPVIAGDGVWSDQGSRTEIEIGGSEARLDQTSELDIERLDEGSTVLRVPQGVLNLTVRYLPPGGIQLVTSVGQLSIQRPGEYHIDAGRPGGPPTQLLLGVVSGQAMFSGLRGAFELPSGQGAMVPPDQSMVQTVAIYPTPFDQWAENRAGLLMASQSAAYVSPEMTGYQDLDANGAWQPMPDYGAVWFPTRVGIGWAPYRDGHWAYVLPWGWTWIDDAPWGFAPFHYGRWAEFDGRWGWIPGERRERPYYAPALVAFVGGEPGGAHVGWVPLGPHEVFRPYYAHSDTYIININRAHFHDEHEITRWDHAPPPSDHFANRQAVTQVNAGAFSGGQPVHQNMAPPAAAGPGRQPAPVMTDFNRLPQAPTQRPQAGPQPTAAAAAPTAGQPQQGPRPGGPQQPGMPQAHPQAAAPPQAATQPQSQAPRAVQPQPVAAAPAAAAAAQPQVPRVAPTPPAQQQPQQQRQQPQQPQPQQQQKKEKEDHDHQNQH